MIAGDHELVLGGHLPVGHEQHIAGRATDLHRDQVSLVARIHAELVDRLAEEVEGADGSRWSTQQEVHRARADHLDRRGTAVGLHHQDRLRQTELGQLRLE